MHNITRLLGKVGNRWLVVVDLSYAKPHISGFYKPRATSRSFKGRGLNAASHELQITCLRRVMRPPRLARKLSCKPKLLAIIMFIT